MADDDLQKLHDQNPIQSTSELAEHLNVDQSTVSRRLNEIGKVHKACKWLLYKLSKNNKDQHLRMPGKRCKSSGYYFRNRNAQSVSSPFAP